jgi:hypothetical protein
MPTDIKFYQTLTGTINGVNTSFTISESFTSLTVRYFLNGVEYKPGGGNDYIEVPSANRIDLLTIVPQIGDSHWVHYQPES